MTAKNLVRLIQTTVWEASERALNSDTNTKALESDMYKELTNACNALVNVKKFYLPETEIVEQIDQLLPKIETERDKLFSPIQLTISAGELSTIGKKIAAKKSALAELLKKEKQMINLPFAAKKSAIHRAATSNYIGEIATALAELYEKEKPTIIKLLKLPKWEFVAKYMDKSLPQEYQRHESSDAPGAWERLVSRHKPID